VASVLESHKNRDLAPLQLIRTGATQIALRMTTGHQDRHYTVRDVTAPEAALCDCR